MVRIVVENRHAPRFTDALEAAFDATKRGQPAREIRRGGAECEATPQRGEGVEYVMTARDIQSDDA